MDKGIKIALMAFLINVGIYVQNRNSDAYTFFVKYMDGKTSRIITMQPEILMDSIKEHIWHYSELDKKSAVVKIGLKEKDMRGLERRLELAKERIDENDFMDVIQENFIKNISHYIKDMALRKVAIAVGAWESRWGMSDLAVKHNNYFGIKAEKGDDYAVEPTYEYENGVKIKKYCKFKVYESMKDSVEDFIKRKNVENSYHSDPIKMLANMHEKRYASDKNWLEGVSKVVYQL